MKRFIFGFQRRVWCPKWTPLSSSWRMVTTAIAVLLLLAVVCDGRRPPLLVPRARIRTPPPHDESLSGRETGGCACRFCEETSQRRGSAEIVGTRSHPDERSAPDSLAGKGSTPSLR